MTTIHSPGPWKAGGYQGALLREVVAADGKLVVSVKVRRYDADGVPEPLPQGEGNLRLVLAVPEMLAALERVVRQFEGAERFPTDGIEVAVEEARAVIIKIKGESNVQDH